MKPLVYRNVHKYVLRSVNLELDAGVYVLRGPNGAGKTTLLKLAAGLLRAERGEVRVLGRNPYTEHRVRALVNYVAVRPLAPLTAKVGEYLRFYAVTRGGEKLPIAEALRALGLDSSMLDSKLYRLSQGQLRRVELAKLLIVSTPVLLIDEPLASLDQQARETVTQLLREEARRACISLIASHDETLLDELGARVVRVERGTAWLSDVRVEAGDGGEGGEHVYEVRVSALTRSAEALRLLTSGGDGVNVLELSIDYRGLVEWLGLPYDGASFTVVDSDELGKLGNVSVLRVHELPVPVRVEAVLEVSESMLPVVLDLLSRSAIIDKLVVGKRGMQP